eukprot:gene2371-8071_t
MGQAPHCEFKPVVVSNNVSKRIVTRVLGKPFSRVMGILFLHIALLVIGKDARMEQREESAQLRISQHRKATNLGQVEANVINV